MTLHAESDHLHLVTDPTLVIFSSEGRPQGIVPYRLGVPPIIMRRDAQRGISHSSQYLASSVSSAHISGPKYGSTFPSLQQQPVGILLFNTLSSYSESTGVAGAQSMPVIPSRVAPQTLVAKKPGKM